MNDVLTKLREADYDNANWRKLGLELGLHERTLNVIDRDHPNNTDGCHTESLTRWLKRADDVDKQGKPTYNVLATALYNIGLKDEADYIRKYILYSSNSNGHHYYLSVMHFVYKIHSHPQPKWHIVHSIIHIHSLNNKSSLYSALAQYNIKSLLNYHYYYSSNFYN